VNKTLSEADCAGSQPRGAAPLEEWAFVGTIHVNPEHTTEPSRINPTRTLPIIPAPESAIPIIRSRHDGSQAPAPGWRRWQHLTMRAQLTIQGPSLIITPDTGASISLVDERFLQRYIPNAVIRPLDQPMSLKGIGDHIHRCNSYTKVTVFLAGTDASERKVRAAIDAELRIVSNLEPGLLMGMDVLGKEDAIINIGSRYIIFPHCNATKVRIETKPKSQAPYKTRKIVARQHTVIPAQCAGYVGFRATRPLPTECDLNFRPCRNSSTRATAYEGWMTSDSTHVLVRNDTCAPVTVQKGARLGYAFMLDIDGCYRASKDLGVGAAIPGKTEADEIVQANGTHIYGKAGSQDVNELGQVCDKFPKLFSDRGTTVDIPVDRQMRIPLIPGWENVKLNIKPYQQTPEERKIINALFNKLHADGKMSWSTQGTHFGCLVFVVWKNVTDKDGNVTRKGRPVVDLRALNEAVVKDSYPLRLQTDILQEIKGATHISVIDGVSFFYQWLIAEKDCHKFAINLHRGQEYLHVAIMGYVNSIQHVQRQMEHIMRDLSFVRVYVDDFIIYSNSLAEHKQHLTAVFERLDGLRFSLNLKKCFIGYPSATILSQHVDAFGLATTSERMAAVLDLKFPRNAAQLETYIGAVGYLRDKVPYFAQVAAPLQDLKTALLKEAPGGRRERKRYAENRRVEPTADLQQAFDSIQQCIAKNTKLIHHDPRRPLYIEVDASKQWGFGVFVYHVMGDPEPTMEAIPAPPGFENAENGPTAWLKKVKDFPEHLLQPIMFLSKRLSTAEQNYYPTELEMSAVVWTIQKLRQMVGSSRRTYVLTDHSAVTAVAKQKLLASSSPDKLNLRLIRCGQFIQQFPYIDARYRQGRTHFVPDALSRLDGVAAQKDTETDVLEDIEYMYYTSAGWWEADDDPVFVYDPEQLRWRVEDPRRLPKTGPRPHTEPIYPALRPTADQLEQVQGMESHPATKSRFSPRRTNDHVKVFNATLVALTDSFKTRLQNAYKADTHLKKVQDMLRNGTSEEEDTADYGTRTDATTGQVRQRGRPLRGIDFLERDGLIYHINHVDGTERLAIPKAMEHEVFKLAHDDCFHGGFNRTYERIRATMFVRHLARHLRTYIKYCGPCLQN
jgi:hypothetical protein